MKNTSSNLTVISNTEDLACTILGIEYEKISNSDDCTEQIEEALIDKMGIDLETLYRITLKLLPLIDIGEGLISGIRYKGFSKEYNNKGSLKAKIWLARIPIIEGKGKKKMKNKVLKL